MDALALTDALTADAALALRDGGRIHGRVDAHFEIDFGLDTVMALAEGVKVSQEVTAKVMRT